MGKYTQLVEGTLAEQTKFKKGQDVKMLRGEFIGDTATVVGIENVGEDDERYAVKYKGEIYKFEPKGLKEIDVEEKKSVTESNMRLMLREKYSRIVDDKARAKWSKVSEKDFADDKDSQEKADKGFLDKLIVYIEKEATRILSSQCPQDKMDEFIRRSVGDIEREFWHRKEKWFGPKPKSYYWSMYVNKESLFHAQIDNWLKSNSNETNEIKDKAQGLMKDMSKEKIALAGMLSGLVPCYELERYVERIKTQDMRDIDWESLVNALEKVKDIRIQ